MRVFEEIFKLLFVSAVLFTAAIGLLISSSLVLGLCFAAAIGEKFSQYNHKRLCRRYGAGIDFHERLKA